MPLVSVILPVYKSNPAHLTASIASAISSAPVDSEIHIGLDGPYCTSGLEQIERIQSFYVNKVIRITQLPKLGLAYTLNTLIERSDCQYLARQDSDDICLPKRLGEQLKALETSKASSFCGTQITRCDINLKPHKRQRLYPRSFRGQLIYASLLNNPMAHPTLMLKREILERIKYRPVGVAEDWDLYIQLWQAGYRSFNLDQSGLLYRMHPEQATKQNRDSKTLCDLKYRSLQAATHHYQSSRLLKPIQKIANATQLTEMAINTKAWLDR